ncbi:MAG: cation diffusion facilitator family transporter [Spirochaetia bacterium]|nr:cation diffusion facilitator family transporter [Spirochaetia bacterium]
MGSHHNKENKNSSLSNIKTAFLLNFFFTIIEFAGGIFTNSIAIISDAIHDLGDTLALGLSYFMEKLSRKKRDAKYTYGYKRFSLLSALVNSVVLVTGSIIVFTEAIPRLFNPPEVNEKGMFILAILGILFNGIAYLRLKKGDSLNEKAVSLHILEDTVGWIIILLGSIFLFFFDFRYLDPIMSIVLAVIIIINGFKIFKKTYKIFLQSIPDAIDVNKIEKEILSVKGVLSIHDTHIWTLDGNYFVFTSHVVIPEKVSVQKLTEIKCKVKDIIIKNNIEHETIEMERENEDCKLKNC